MKSKNSQASLSSKIIAHRGASFDAPEHTVASARLGWEQDADGLEMDLYLTTDGYLAVMHDESLLRTARVEGSIEEKSLAELKQLEVGKWKGNGFAGEKIPTLEELLETAASDKLMVIEIKTSRDVLAPLIKAFESTKIADRQVVLICFDYEALKKLKSQLPQYEALWLVDRDQAGEPTTLEELIDLCEKAGFDGLNLSGSWPIDRTFVEKVHNAKLKLGVWTVDDAKRARALVEAGVDFFATNRPGWIRKKLEVLTQ